jgi:hypothetical protein
MLRDEIKKIKKKSKQIKNNKKKRTKLDIKIK